MTTKSVSRAPEPPTPDDGPLGPNGLTGHIAVVTGGASGMGWSCAEAFGQAGAAVAVLARNPEKIETAVSRLTHRGVKAMGVSVDVRRADAVAAAFDEIVTTLGVPTLLANNAGGNFPVLAERMSANQWRSVIQIALDGTYHCCEAFVARLGDRSGAIVNNSAQYVWTGFPADAHSAAAKSGMLGLTQALAVRWAPRVRVNCIAAGFFPYGESRTEDPDEDSPEMQRIEAMIPAGRAGRRREFGWLAAYLCSPHAAGISGQTIVVDGGDRLRRRLFSPAFQPPREREDLW